MVVGVDPGSVRTGVGLVAAEGTRYRCVHFEVIRLEGELSGRLWALQRRLGEILAEHRPTAAAVESPYFGRSAPSAFILAQARGAALAALAGAGLPPAAYPPARVKSAVTGSGRAEKPQVARMVAALLGLDSLPPPDAADALAVALCHAMLRAAHSPAG